MIYGNSATDMTLERLYPFPLSLRHSFLMPLPRDDSR